MPPAGSNRSIWHHEVGSEEVGLRLNGLRPRVDADPLGAAEHSLPGAVKTLADPVAERVSEGEALALRALVLVQHNAAPRWEEGAARTVEVPLLDGETEQVLGDRLDEHEQLNAAEDGVVVLAQLVRPWIVVP